VLPCIPDGRSGFSSSSHLELGDWNFPGAWNLEFGASPMAVCDS
jgi:hypothetical protein